MALGVWWHHHRARAALARLTEEERLVRVCTRWGLSPRGCEVAMLLRLGRSNREIEDTLFISLSTVKNHVHHILTKAGVGSRLAFIRKLEAGMRVCASGRCDEGLQMPNEEAPP